MKKRYLFGVASLAAFACLGVAYYHDYEYQPLTYHFADGSSVSVSRHNLKQMTPSQRQVFLHPVNETVLHTCIGNPQDQCILLQSIPLWPGGSEGAGNPALKPFTGEPNEIMGRIVDDSTPTLQLKASSGRIVSVIYPTNVVGDFNAKRAASYGISITVGDEVYVSYGGPMRDNVIRTDQVIQSLILMKGNGKTGAPEKY